MTDVELLQAAAKAAGIEAEWYRGCGDALHLTASDTTAIYWNPLRDDGQAFRLANALRLAVYHTEAVVSVKNTRSGERMGEFVNEGTGDRNASARRAIVRAAAAMAEQPAVGAA